MMMRTGLVLVLACVCLNGCLLYVSHLLCPNLRDEHKEDATCYINL